MNSWFKVLLNGLTDHGFDPHDIYSVDKTGYIMSRTQSERAIRDADNCLQPKLFQSGCRVKTLFEVLFILAESSTHSNPIANKKIIEMLATQKEENELKRKTKKRIINKAYLSLDEFLELDSSVSEARKGDRSENSKLDPLPKLRKKLRRKRRNCGNHGHNELTHTALSEKLYLRPKISHNLALYIISWMRNHGSVRACGILRYIESASTNNTALK